MHLGELIKAYRDEHKMSQSEFAKHSGISKGYVSMLENNRNPMTGEPIAPTYSIFEKVAKALCKSVNEVISALDDSQLISFNENSWQERVGLVPIGRKNFPLLGEVACGEPIFANESIELYVDSYTGVKADFCLKAKGDSMVNARINDGDIIFIKKCDIVDNGSIGVVIIDDEATLKRIYYYPESEKLVLLSENPNYEPFVFVGEELDHVHILGKAVAFQSDIV